MKNKQGATRIWLPLIFAIVLSSGCSAGGVASVGAPVETQPPQAHPQPLPPPPVAASASQGAGVDFIIQDLMQRFPGHRAADRFLLVDATAQRMRLVENGGVSGEWVISTALKGLGSRKGSEQTPVGVHRVAQKIGAGAPFGAIFKARQNSGRIATILTGPDQDSAEDNVTTRILWLDGMEPGVNKGGSVDSHERYIYIHGTDEEGKLGRPASHGCIRMRNQDVMELFDRVDENTLVVITAQKS